MYNKTDECGKNQIKFRYNMLSFLAKEKVEMGRIVGEIDSFYSSSGPHKTALSGLL